MTKVASKANLMRLEHQFLFFLNNKFFLLSDYKKNEVQKWGEFCTKRDKHCLKQEFMQIEKKRTSKNYEASLSQQYREMGMFCLMRKL